MEDKIVGPLTLKQFAYILGAGGFSFLIWTFIPLKWLAIILIIPIAGVFLALAFIKVNQRPFIEVLESAFNYYSSSKIYTWRQPNAVEQAKEKNIVAQATQEVVVAKANSNKLHEIAVGLDVLDRGHDDEVSSQQ